MIYYLENNRVLFKFHVITGTAKLPGFLASLKVRVLVLIDCHSLYLILQCLYNESAFKIDSLAIAKFFTVFLQWLNNPIDS